MFLDQERSVMNRSVDAAASGRDNIILSTKVPSQE